MSKRRIINKKTDTICWQKKGSNNVQLSMLSAKCKTAVIGNKEKEKSARATHFA